MLVEFCHCFFVCIGHHVYFLVKWEIGWSQSCKVKILSLCIKIKINCKTRDVMYRMKCLGCTENDEREGTCIGETARSIRERLGEHLVTHKQNEKNSAFYKHVLERHDSVPQDVNVEILAVYSGDAMLRQVTEAVLSMN